MASSSSTYQIMKRYNVFINFRGEDIRSKFLSHLLKALHEKSVDTFVDEEVDKGDNISVLFENIEKSCISVPIFSENYANSNWCLDELVKIVECNKTKDQIVIPVFYDVHPTDVKNQRGSFGNAFAKLTQQLSYQEVKIWSKALRKTAKISGFVSQNIKDDSKLIELIVNDILKKLDQMSSNDHYNDELVGIDSRVKHCIESLCLGSSEARVLGIWGMGGIGKTTIANKIFDQIKDQFTTRCFLANVRQRHENGSIDCLQNEILGKILKNGTKISDIGNSFMSSSFRGGIARRKVLIVLDDVSDSEQIKLLIGEYDIFGPGSRIIITSRDKHVIEYITTRDKHVLGHGPAEIYEVKELNSHEALSLFCVRAFKQSMPNKGYEALVDSALGYAQGIPLAVIVLASILYNRIAKEWEDELEKLKETSDEKIGKILRISYDGLDPIDKEIFIEIACLFNGEDEHRLEGILERDGSRIGISRLCDKSLISRSADNKLYVHDLLQQMARDISREEAQLGNHWILWHHKDIYDLLTRDEGSGAIKGISLDMSKIKDIQLKPTAFERMYNLRYLMVRNSCPKNRIHLPGGLTLLPTELRILHWEGYASNSLPSNSFLENLVELLMPRSQLKELWNAQLVLRKLKLIDLSHCKELIQLPDFSTTPNVEILLLGNCKKLRSLPQTLGSLEFLQTLKLSDTAVKNLPESICSLKHLKKLDISDSKRIHSLPDNFGNLVSLEDFLATRTRINHVPSSFSQLQKLSCLYFSHCEGFILPPLEFDFPCLTMLNLHGCGMLEFPVSICNLTSLKQLYIGGNNFESIPENIKQLSNLVDLSVSENESLKYLPELPSQSLYYLGARDCTSLESAFSSIQLLQKQQKLIQFGFGNCINLNPKEYNHIIEHVFPMEEKDKPQGKPMLCIPGTEVVEKIMYQKKTQKVKKKGSSHQKEKRKGSSLSFSSSSRPPEEMDFYFCAVYEPKKRVDLPVICCRVTITDDESRQIYMTCCSYDNHNHDWRNLTDIVYSAHMFLWLDKIYFLQGIGDQCTIHFHFFHSTYPEIYEDDSDLLDVDIMACGVHPVFKDPILTLKEDEDHEKEYEDEEEDEDEDQEDEDEDREEEEEDRKMKMKMPTMTTKNRKRKRKRKLHLKN